MTSLTAQCVSAIDGSTGSVIGGSSKGVHQHVDSLSRRFCACVWPRLQVRCCWQPSGKICSRCHNRVAGTTRAQGVRHDWSMIQNYLSSQVVRRRVCTEALYRHPKFALASHTNQSFTPLRARRSGSGLSLSLNYLLISCCLPLTTLQQALHAL